MTILEINGRFCVFKMKRQQDGGYATDMSAKKFSWFISGAAKPKFTGCYGDCASFVEKSGAVLMDYTNTKQEA